MAPDAPPADDPALAAEREHLRRSRGFLRLMREDVLSLKALGGDPVSQEFLKAGLYRRAESLSDLPGTPLFFGRLDYAEDGQAVAGPAPAGAVSGAPAAADAVPAPQADESPDPPAGAFAGERFHVGRRHVHDGDGHPVVIDWRAPVSRPFYRASPAEPMGLARRRRFGFSGGDLTAYEDEEFPGQGMHPAARPAGRAAAAPAAQAGIAEQTVDAPAASRILIDEIERPRSGPMRDIVATIQPEQDDIVRAQATQSVCVQGAPGTGKTAVGLHRVAYLLYAHRERMIRGGVLVVGPNRAFLAYIRNVLPALGEVQVTQLSVANLLASVPVRGRDSEQAARIKGSAAMAQVLRRALWEQVTEPAASITIPRGSRRWRISALELAELTQELRARGVRYAAGREMLGHRIAHLVLTRMEAAGETCDDRTHDAVRRTRQVRAAVDAVWPKTDPARLVARLLSDPALLGRAADGILDAAVQEAITWPAPPRGPGSARWSPADAVLIDEARDLLQRTPSLAHVVVDEAQDLSPMECRAIGRRCATGSVTVLGDIAQGTTPWAASSWQQLLGHLGKQDASLRILDTGYRVPRQILDFASQLLTSIAPGLGPARSVRHDAGSLVITRAGAQSLPRLLSAACAEALDRPGSAAVIAADDDIAALSRALSAAGQGHALIGADGETRRAGGKDENGRQDEAAGGGAGRLVLVPVTLAKGLEFDQVIVVEPARIAAAESRGLHRLYVALTRAVSRLTVLHAEPLPGPLTSP
jgi:DNA helicase IV